MRHMKIAEHFNEKHNLYLFYSIPILFLIGRSVVDIVFTYLGFHFLIDRLIIKKDYSIIKNKIFLYALYFYLMHIFISFFSTNINISLFKSFTGLRFLIFFGATVYIIKKNSFNLKIFYKVIYISILFINTDILLQYIFGYDFFGYEPVKNAVNSYRYSGSFGDEFIAGNYIQTFLLILVTLKISNLNKFYKKYFSEFIILYSIIIVLITGDRMAFISVFYSLFFLLIFFKQNRKYLITISLMIFVTFSSLIVLDKGISDRVSTIPKQLLVKKNEEFSNPHLNLAKQAIQIFKNNKIFGTGLKTFRETCSLKENVVILKNDINNFCSNHPHNYYFEVLSDTGFLGFISFILFIIYLLYSSGFKKLYNNNNKLSFICLLIFLFPLSTTGSFFTNMNACYFWYLISLINLSLVSERKY